MVCATRDYFARLTEEIDALLSHWREAYISVSSSRLLVKERKE